MKCKVPQCTNNVDKHPLSIYCLDHKGVGTQQPMHRQLMKCKERAQKKNLQYDLDYKYLLSLYPKGMLCPILGIKMEFGDNNGGRNTAPSVDRIDCNKGYVKGNVQIISKLANSMKQNANAEQLKKFAKWVNDTY